MLFGTVIGARSWGATLHFFLVLAGLGLAVGPALQISAGLFAEERQQQTLELLYLTGMGSAELFVGKLLGGVLVSSSELMALAPLIAVPFLSGGMSFNLFVATSICLPTIFVAVLAIGSLTSALWRQESSSLVGSGVLTAVFCLALPLPYNLGFWLTGHAPFDKTWLALSPALGPWMVAKSFGGFRIATFWAWTAATWSLSILCLALAAAMLKRNWRRDLQKTEDEGWKARWNELARGSAEWRGSLRRRVMDVNAYQWLAQKDNQPVLQAWVFMAAVSLLWLLGCCAWPRLWLSPLNFYSTAALLLLGIDMLISHSAARRMTTDRRDGALELLLTTSLSPKEILAGQKSAVREQFSRVKWVLSGLMLVMVFAGFLTRTWTGTGVVSYLAIWCVLFVWCWRPAQRSAPLAMWVAANCGRPLYGAFRNSGSGSNRIWVIYWVWMMGNSLGSFGTLARSFPKGSTVEMFVSVAAAFWVVMFILANLRTASVMEEPFISQIRSIAQEPLPERNDPRFKQWKDIRKRFPTRIEGWFERSDEDLPSKPIRAAGVWFWRPLGRVCGIVWGKFRVALLKAARGH
jgi:hypothetical protein